MRKRRVFNPSNQKAGYEYAWVYSGCEGYEIYEAQADGWELVKNSDPEGRDRINLSEDNNVHFSDTILMRIKTELRNEVREEKAARDRRLSGFTEEEALAEKIRRSGGKIKPVSFTDPNELIAQNQGGK